MLRAFQALRDSEAEGDAKESGPIPSTSDATLAILLLDLYKGVLSSIHKSIPPLKFFRELPLKARETPLRVGDAGV